MRRLTGPSYRDQPWAAGLRLPHIADLGVLLLDVCELLPSCLRRPARVASREGQKPLALIRLQAIKRKDRGRILTATAATAMLVLAPTATAWAGNPSGTGQPSQSCQEQPSQPSSPGNASSASGSAFNGSGTAGTVYAGEQPQNSKNPTSVSQYDVACYQVSHH